PHCFPHQNGERVERYSRKVFVGGLPPDIDEDEITASFRRFGHLFVDWPHKAESKSYFPPKGYAFLLFQDESSVQALIDACIEEDGKLYLCVSSPTIKDKPVSENTEENAVFFACTINRKFIVIGISSCAIRISQKTAKMSKKWL
uniref:RRM domain-containing protein n=1 Tax=Oryzias sinensis TaxID=183150 RepID=A0A8C7XTE6_9TELE